MALGFLSPVHVAFLLLVVVLLFGAKRLPELGNSLGSGLRGFKESLEGKDAHAQGARVDDTSASTRPTAPALEPVVPDRVRRTNGFLDVAPLDDREVLLEPALLLCERVPEIGAVVGRERGHGVGN